MSDPTPTPADTLRAAAGTADPALAALLTRLADASDHHATGEGGTVATVVHPALAVARQLLDSTTAEDTPADEPSADRRARYEEALWVHALRPAAAATDVMAVADAELASLRAELAAAQLAEVWTVWRENEPVYGHYTTVDDARQGTIDCWQDDEPVCPDYSWRQDGPRLELVVGGEHSGVYASRHRVHGTPPAPAVAEDRP